MIPQYFTSSNINIQHMKSSIEDTFKGYAVSTIELKTKKT